MVFRGTYEYTIDERGRVAVPPRYRDAFAEGAVLATSSDGCLELYSAADYEEEARQFENVPTSREMGRRLRRGFFARSFDVELDRQGRILIPPHLRTAAGLTGPVVVVGRSECLEIWARDRWEAELAIVEDQYPAALESLERRA